MPRRNWWTELHRYVSKIMIEKVIPRQASNDYKGSPIALYGMIPFFLLMIFSTYMHFLQPEFAAHQIATIIVFEGQPDPNQVIYMLFSLWGAQQVSFCIVNAVVLYSYRNLISLMYVLWLFTWLMRPLVIQPFFGMAPEHTTGVTPGKVGVPYMIAYLVVMLVLSLRHSRDKPL